MIRDILLTKEVDVLVLDPIRRSFKYFLKLNLSCSKKTKDYGLAEQIYAPTPCYLDTFTNKNLKTLTVYH
jgi:hypothetical protein